VAVGLYLPFELDAVIMLGGLVALLASRRSSPGNSGDKTGILAASGFITGEAIMGILLAMPVALTGNPGALYIIEGQAAAWPGLVFFGLIALWLYTREVSKV